ncbi:MAG: putative phosphonate metabolism protein [Rhodobacteraceae bacterium HLUCCA12]|nr:MAG: putative phosphonate metabolism protein [Rhodobacteraceae bacterium HLUCCA12]
MKRYALYFVPPRGPLAETAARWLGRDAETGATGAHPHPALAVLSVNARRYGFHATLKAPFRLAEGQTEDDLVAAVEVFAAGARPFSIAGLRVASLDGFLALVPDGEPEALNAFAAQVVTRFERFRAPLTEAERAGRNPDRLNPRQRALLDRHGYPFVLDQFRFHMTLTDRLTPDQCAELRPLAERLFAPVLPRPFPIGQIAIFGEGRDGLFHQLHRMRLG